MKGNIVFSVQHLVRHAWRPGSSFQLSSVRKAWPCCTETSEGPQKWWKDWSIQQGWKSWHCSVQRKKGCFFFFLSSMRVIQDRLWDVLESPTLEILEIQLDMIQIKIWVRLVLHDIQRLLLLSAILWLCGTTLSQKCQF